MRHKLDSLQKTLFPIGESFIMDVQHRCKLKGLNSTEALRIYRRNNWKIRTQTWFQLWHKDIKDHLDNK